VDQHFVLRVLRESSVNELEAFREPLEDILLHVILNLVQHQILHIIGVMRLAVGCADKDVSDA
jgi:hypothetical protein